MASSETGYKTTGTQVRDPELSTWVHRDSSLITFGMPILASVRHNYLSLGANRERPEGWVTSGYDAVIDEVPGQELGSTIRRIVQRSRTSASISNSVKGTWSINFVETHHVNDAHQFSRRPLHRTHDELDVLLITLTTDVDDSEVLPCGPTPTLATQMAPVRT